MKTSTKWIFGIVIAVVVVVCVAAAALVAVGAMVVPVSSVETRSGRLWDQDRVFPFRDLDEMPFHMLPRDQFYSNTFPLRLVGLPLLCLGLIFALGLGAVALIVLLNRKSGPASPPTAVAVSPPPVQGVPPVSPVTPATCANCGKPAQPDWSHCPYCGADLAETASPEDVSDQAANS